MPPTRRPRVDVVIRVPKRLPYLPPTAGTGKGKQAEQQQASASSSSDPLIGKPLDGGNNVSSSSSASASGSRALLDGTTAPQVTISAPTDPSSSSSHLPQPQATPAETSCAEWSSLLTWARAARGPQWSDALGMWMVDKGGVEYGSFCGDPAQGVHGPSAEVEVHGDTDGVDGGEKGAPAAADGDDVMRQDGHESIGDGDAGGSRTLQAQQQQQEQQNPQPSSAYMDPPAGGGGGGGGGASFDPAQRPGSGGGGLPPPHFTPGGGGFNPAVAAGAGGNGGAGQAARHAGLPMGGAGGSGGRGW
ncbi:hypothetical protein BDZ90DRAFT_232350 [Jaminaea rosea]|uniref:Uncharacterized protein n=1 Tax=Jaminaea rosea TaxID=1569628 RepID=A0A316UQ07_9BASI|nr:hypothetical protein BDZ90DRAFT_232350 [Jaminaea rosea]PWN27370.1 hypothetical protein BDZ90DRAFT_232350 [Jaminaea rosea]